MRHLGLLRVVEELQADLAEEAAHWNYLVHACNKCKYCVELKTVRVCITKWQRERNRDKRERERGETDTQTYREMEV